MQAHRSKFFEIVLVTHCFSTIFISLYFESSFRQILKTTADFRQQLSSLLPCFFCYHITLFSFQGAGRIQNRHLQTEVYPLN